MTERRLLSNTLNATKLSTQNRNNEPLTPNTVYSTELKFHGLCDDGPYIVDIFNTQEKCSE